MKTVVVTYYTNETLSIAFNGKDNKA